MATQLHRTQLGRGLISVSTSVVLSFEDHSCYPIAELVLGMTEALAVASPGEQRLTKPFGFPIQLGNLETMERFGGNTMADLASDEFEMVNM